MRSASALLVVLVLLVTAFAADLAAPLSLTVLKAEVGADMATGMPVLTITLDPASTEAFAAFTATMSGSGPSSASTARGSWIRSSASRSRRAWSR